MSRVGEARDLPSEPATRQCSECGRQRPLTDFLRARLHPGGRLGKCLECIKAAAERDRLVRERRQREAAA